MLFRNTYLFLEKYALLDKIHNQAEFKNSLESIRQVATSNESQIIQELLSLNTTVYLQWVVQDKQILKFLDPQAAVSVFKDEQKISEHTYFKEFKSFLSKYISDAFIKRLDQNHDKLVLASYLPLLQEDIKILIEDKLSANLLSKLKNDLLKAQEVKTENELQQLILPYLSDENIAFLNLLSRTSYDKKLFYVDGLLSVVNTKACTPRLANFIIKKADEINLHGEHKSKLAELKSELRAGKIKVKNFGKKDKLAGFRIVLTLLLIAILVGGSYYFFKNQDPFADEDKEELSKNAFNDISIEDRKKIDSLIKLIEPQEKPFLENDGPDSFLGMQLLDVVVSQDILNEDVRNFLKYTDTSIIQSLATKDSCLNLASEDLTLGNFKPLSQNSGRNSVDLKNSSAYDLIILVFENTLGGKSHFEIVKSKTSVTFKCKVNDNVIFLVGNQLLQDNDNLRFCEVDANSLILSHSVYTVDAVNKQAKIIIFGNKTKAVEIKDLNQIFK